MNEETLLRLPQVIERVGVSRATLYRWIADGTFPPPRLLGLRAVAWLSTEIDGWIQERQPARRPAE